MIEKHILKLRRMKAEEPSLHRQTTVTRASCSLRSVRTGRGALLCAAEPVGGEQGLYVLIRKSQNCHYFTDETV